MNLTDVIIGKIKKEGPISFNEFMDMALYFPGMGYYTSSEPRIGKRGDFYTSPYISAAFGAMIGRQLEEMWLHLDGDLTIVEFGAGSGLLCYDILQYLKNNKACYEGIRYVIIEKNPELRNTSKKYLTEKVVWLDDIEQLGPFQGCILSNELFDNFPVHRILRQDRVMEIFIDYRDGLKEITQPAGIHIMNQLHDIQLRLPDGSATEICLEAEEWFSRISRQLIKGYVITIDYGYHMEEFISCDKHQGTLRCYYNHRIHHNPYIHIGHQDITADVNFFALSFWGNRYGLDFSGLTEQSFFLRALGFVPYLAATDDSEENKKFAASLLINEMGKRFKVLIQRKNIPQTTLRGMIFQRPLD